MLTTYPQDSGIVPIESCDDGFGTNSSFITSEYSQEIDGILASVNVNHSNLNSTDEAMMDKEYVEWMKHVHSLELNAPMHVITMDDVEYSDGEERTSKMDLIQFHVSRDKVALELNVLNDMSYFIRPGYYEETVYSPRFDLHQSKENTVSYDIFGKKEKFVYSNQCYGLTSLV